MLSSTAMGLHLCGVCVLQAHEIGHAIYGLDAVKGASSQPHACFLVVKRSVRDNLPRPTNLSSLSCIT